MCRHAGNNSSCPYSSSAPSAMLVIRMHANSRALRSKSRCRSLQGGCGHCATSWPAGSADPAGLTGLRAVAGAAQCAQSAMSWPAGCADPASYTDVYADCRAYSIKDSCWSSTQWAQCAMSWQARCADPDSYTDAYANCRAYRMKGSWWSSMQCPQCAMSWCGGRPARARLLWRPS